MEPWSSILQRVILERWADLGVEEQALVVALIAADRPTLVVRAMDHARAIELSVSERPSDS
jgi:hypothetical protein